jgi:hypothetical protein
MVVPTLDWNVYCGVVKHKTVRVKQGWCDTGGTQNLTVPYFNFGPFKMPMPFHGAVMHFFYND